MKKIILFLIAGLLISIQSFSQKNEYRYIALKFGGSHGFSPTPGMNENKYLDTPDGEMQLSPTGSAYVPGFVFDFYYHFDFVTDNAGIFTGLEYNYGGIAAKYDTDFGGYTLKETHRFQSVGIPVAFKYGPDIWKTQRYLYVGAQINFNFAMSSNQKVNWENGTASVKLTADEYSRTAFNLIAGINYGALNLQLDFYPNTLFNKTYETDLGYMPYDGQVEKLFVLKTSLNIPYGWLSEKSFWWRKFLRNTFWR